MIRTSLIILSLVVFLFSIIGIESSICILLVLDIIGANAQSRLNFLAGRITAHSILETRSVVVDLVVVLVVISSQKDRQRSISSSSSRRHANQYTILVSCGTIFQGTLWTGRYPYWQTRKSVMEDSHPTNKRRRSKASASYVSGSSIVPCVSLVSSEVDVPSGISLGHRPDASHVGAQTCITESYKDSTNGDC